MRVMLFAVLVGIAGVSFAAPYTCPPSVNASVVACTFSSPGGTTTYTASVTAEASANKGTNASLSLLLSLDTEPCDSIPTVQIPVTTLGQISGRCRFVVTSARPVTFLAVSQSPGATATFITLDAQSIAFVPEFLLTVTTVGDGTVTSTDGRVNCGYSCLVVYGVTARVTLTANAAAGSVFTGWGGACSGSARTCTVTMSDAQNVTANFAVENKLPPVVEFYNAPLDHFFITAVPAEATAIDMGNAGPGWTRTGLSFNQGGDTPVCRFYGSVAPGPNSHFYSAFAAECSALMQLAATTPASQPRWNSEGFAFATGLPVNEGCLAGTVPVYRAYNDGFRLSKDSNHRFSTDVAAIQGVIARGWIYEGVAMCAPK